GYPVGKDLRPLLYPLHDFQVVSIRLGTRGSNALLRSANKVRGGTFGLSDYLAHLLKVSLASAEVLVTSQKGFKVFQGSIYQRSRNHPSLQLSQLNLGSEMLYIPVYLFYDMNLLALFRDRVCLEKMGAQEIEGAAPHQQH